MCGHLLVGQSSVGKSSSKRLRLNGVREPAGGPLPFSSVIRRIKTSPEWLASNKKIPA
jgi:hypothetical protein